MTAQKVYVEVINSHVHHDIQHFKWLKPSNVSLACEERMHHVSKRIVGDNIQGELAPLTSGREELRAAPLVFIPNLIQKVTQLLDENHR